MSRNNALMRASADIVLFADDDMTYCDDYATKIIDAFERNPDADILFFNITSEDNSRETARTNTFKRIRKWNSLKYGAVNIAARKESLDKARINFSLSFGGGAKYSSGEDSLFIFDCLNKGLRIYALPTTIGSTHYDDSSWFDGYNDTFLNDKGALFRALSPTLYKLLIIQFAIRKKRLFSKKYSYASLTKKMLIGAQKYQTRWK